jgi:uncharacterized protein YndB with AHSA1/START domain
MITVETTLQAPLSKVWECWTQPEYIVHWNFASDDWCCPSAINDARDGGMFNWQMEAKDGSMGFEFMGVYDHVIDQELITYRLSDGRKVEIRLKETDGEILLTESFEPEGTNADEMQRAGWQAILDNFKKYVESNL